MSNVVIEECHVLMLSLSDIPFDKALPTMQKGLWEIAEKHNISGPEVFKQYMDWKSKQ